MRPYFLLLVILLIAYNTYSAPLLERGGSGCPDNFCVWIIGQDFGKQPILYVYNDSKLISRYPYPQGPTQNPGSHSVTLMLRSSLEMDLYESEGLTFKILKTETREFSNKLLIKRDGPLSESIIRKKARLPLQMGGTNYVMYDLGEYLQNHDLWGDPIRGVKMLIARYHQNKQIVKSQIKAIADSGQKVISIMFWYVIYPGQPDNVFMHTVDISNGIPNLQYQNAKEILNEIKKYNFEQVILRVGPQGNESPDGWSSWNEESYKKQWRAIDQLIDLFNKELAGTAINPLFDLAGEGAGIDKGFGTQFGVRLWKDYTEKYGNINSTAMSAAYYPGRIKKMVEEFDAAGLPRPNQYAVDIYGAYDWDGNFYRLAKELQALGEIHKPVLLQETYYNDANMMQIVNKARNEFGLNIVRIVQWNLTRQGDIQGDKHFSLVNPSLYSAYKSIQPQPYFGKLEVINSNFICFQGAVKNINQKTKLHVYDYVGLNKRIKTYLPGEYSVSGFLSKKIKFCLITPEEVDEWNKGGVSIKLENENSNYSVESILTK